MALTLALASGARGSGVLIAEVMPASQREGVTKICIPPEVAASCARARCGLAPIAASMTERPASVERMKLRNCPQALHGASPIIAALDWFNSGMRHRVDRGVGRRCIGDRDAQAQGAGRW